MEKGKFLVDTDKKTVTFGHVTKTMDGEVTLTTTFDFANVGLQRLLYDAGTARLIRWRATAGIKKLATVEAVKLDNTIVDCSKTIERVKHVETAEEKELKATIQALLAGKGGTKMSMADLLKRVKEMQAATEEDEMEAGEATEN